MKRRAFIQSTAMAATAAMVIPSWGAASKKKIGLQLYSLRDVINKDVKGILRQVADFGYTNLETYGYKEGMLFGMKAAEFGAYVKSLGMKVVSGHFGIDLVDKGWDKVCADSKEIGQEYVVVPWMAEQYYKTTDDLKKTCALLNKGGETAKKYGLRMGYHNHAFEFKEVDGKRVFDTMLAELDPKLVGMEMDIFWVVNAGADPLQYFEKYPGRFEQWHVKDMDKSDKGKNADVGSGAIDFKPIFAKAKQAGMKRFYVEQETYPSSPLESVKNCSTYLKTIL